MYKRHYLKKLMSALICAVMLLSLLPVTALADEPEGFAGGGTEGTPYLIAGIDDLARLAELVNAGNTDYNNKYYQLTADLDFNSDTYDYFPGCEGWAPIGTSDNRFNGTFDGDGHTVNGVYINSIAPYKGLFGVINAGATVENVNVTEGFIVGGLITGGSNFGGLAGHNYGTISNCSFTGYLSGGDGSKNVGGIAGYNTGTITDCRNAGSISFSDGSATAIGGIAGQNEGTVSYCCNTDTVSISDGESVGGIIGYNSTGGSVSCCYNTGSISGTKNTGGLIGYGHTGTTVLNCYNTGGVLGSSEETGGIIGWNNTGGSASVVSYCYNTGNVSGSSTLGGVAGDNDAIVKNCAALNSSVTGDYFISRVAGSFSGTLFCNYAFSGMTGGRGFKTLNGVDGADMTLAQLYDPGFWTTDGNWDGSAWDSTIWTFSTNKLPILTNAGGNQTGDPPAHLILYTVTYDANGGSVGNDPVPTESDKAAGATFTAAPANSFTAPAEQRFKEWNTKSDGTGTRYAAGETVTMPASALTLYAIWADAYSVTYHANNGTGTAPIESDEAEGATITVAPANCFTAPAEQRFKEWNTKSDGTGTRYAAGASITMPAENLILYAIWDTSSAWNGNPDTDWYDGHEDDPSFTITTAEELAGLAGLVNGETTDFSDKIITLGDDIVLNTWSDSDVDGIVDSGELSNSYNTNNAAIDWAAIGTSGNWFNGTFNGGGHTVSGVYINSTDSYQGLFGVIDTGATVKNVGVTDGYIHGGSNFGGFAGYNYGTISNCSFTGSLSGSDGTKCVGGIAGYSNGTITDCRNSGSISFSGSQTESIGGIAGQNKGEVSYCCSTGTVSISGGESAGGIVGYNNTGGSVSCCYNTGSISGKTEIGGVVGWNKTSSAKVSYCYNTGSVSVGESVGGVVGWNDENGKVENCAALNSSVSFSFSFVHRVAGRNTGTLSANYAFAGMTGGGSDKALDGADGADMTLAQLYDPGFWTTADNWDGSGWDSSIWTFSTDKLPVLKNVGGGQTGDPPAHLLVSVYSITYAANGGTGTAPTESDKTEGASFTAAPANSFTAPNGQQFKEWNTSSLGDGDSYAAGTSITMPAGNLTLYAIWTNAYSVTYHANNGTGTAPIESDEAEGATITVAPANSFTAPAGQKFKEWNTKSDGTGTRYAAGATVTMPAENLILYAIWNTPSAWDGNIPSKNFSYTFSGGYGSKGNPYHISSAADLAQLAANVNGGYGYSGVYFIMTDNIVLNENYSDYETWGTIAPANIWTPIGNSSYSFLGNFNGAGHTVSGIYINSDNVRRGLFCTVYRTGTVSNLGVVDSYICCSKSGYVYTGGVVGSNEGTVENCYNTGIVTNSTSSDGFGGVVGYNSGTVKNCYNTGSVTGRSCVGGVVGMNSGGMVQNCHNEGAATGSLYSVGGLIGYFDGGTVQYCYNEGAVNCSGNSAGGLLGYFTGGTVQYCYNEGAVSCSGNSAGGIVGRIYADMNDGTVQCCYNTGSVSGGDYTGGVVGRIYAYMNDGTVQYCYNTGLVSGGDYTGGVAGWMNANAYEGNTVVKNCAAMNAFVSGASSIGRVAGDSDSSLSCNYAFSGITGGGSDITQDGNDGADMTLAQLYDPGFWTTAGNWDGSGWDSGTWTFSTDKLPILKNVGGDQVGDPPDHLVIYTVTYDANGGSGTAPTESDKAAGATFTAAPANSFTAPTGKQFKQWNTESDGSGTSYAAGAEITMPAENLTLYAIWEATPASTGSLIVTVAGSGGSVTRNGKGIGSSHTEQLATNTNVRLEAVPEAGYTFAYWAIVNDYSERVISTDSVYEHVLGAGIHIKAVFSKTPTGGESKYTVTFKDKSGRILKSTDVARNGQAAPPANPAIVGYRFTGWNKSYDSVTRDLIITAAYAREETTYTVTAVNGTLSEGGTSGEHQFDMPVTVTADTAPAGQQFSHWTMDGVKVSTKSTFSFFSPMKNIRLTAVFTDDGAPLNDVPFITLLDDVMTDETNGSMMFTAIKNVPEDFTLVECGALLASGELSGELTLDTTGVRCLKINNFGNDMFYARKTDIGAGEMWNARAYLIYQDGNGNLVTVYSSATVNRTMGGE